MLYGPPVILLSWAPQMPVWLCHFLAQTSYKTFLGLFPYQKKNGFYGNCLIRAGEKMKSIHEKDLAKGQALCEQLTIFFFSFLFCPLAIISHALLYDNQIGLFCRISTLPHSLLTTPIMITSLFFPPCQILPLLQL